MDVSMAEETDVVCLVSETGAASMSRRRNPIARSIESGVHNGKIAHLTLET